MSNNEERYAAALQAIANIVIRMDVEEQSTLLEEQIAILHSLGLVGRVEETGMLERS